MSMVVRRGFLLLEAVVALVVVSMIAGGALELRGAEARAAAREPPLLIATALAQDRLAALRLLEVQQLAHVPDSLARGRFAPPFANYRWQSRVRRGGEPDLYELRVDVAWPNGSLMLTTRLFAPTTGVTR